MVFVRCAQFAAAPRCRPAGRAPHRVVRPLAALGLLVVIETFPADVAVGETVLPARGIADPASETVVFAGCDANLSITRLLARAFTRTRPDLKVRMESVGSTNGIALAASGVVHIGLVSRPFRDPEEARGLTVRPYAKTAVVIAAGPDVPDVSLTSADLLALYRGTKERWPSRRPVAFFTREQGDSSIASLRQTLAGFAAAYADGARTHHWTVLYSEPSMHEALLMVPFALGLSDLGAITTDRLPIMALAIDGVAPTLENVGSGRYRFTKTLAFVWRESSLPERGRAFLEFVDSAEAARILAAHGYLPLSGGGHRSTGRPSAGDR
jgi:phosphate transport system substrate-binding protein